MVFRDWPSPLKGEVGATNDLHTGKMGGSCLPSNALLSRFYCPPEVGEISTNISPCYLASNGLSCWGLDRWEHAGERERGAVQPPQVALPGAYEDVRASVLVTPLALEVLTASLRECEA